MKLIREPEFSIIACKCRTAFKPEVGDVLYYKFSQENPFEVENIYTRCPTCDSLCEVAVVRMYDVTCSEKGGAK